MPVGKRSCLSILFGAPNAARFYPSEKEDGGILLYWKERKRLNAILLYIDVLMSGKPVISRCPVRKLNVSMQARISIRVEKRL